MKPELFRRGDPEAVPVEMGYMPVEVYWWCVARHEPPYDWPECDPEQACDLNCHWAVDA